MSPTKKKYNFDGKVAIVTGSSSGIGAAIAIQFAQYGARVTITGREGANLAKVAQEIEKVSGGVKPLQLIGDLRDGDSFRAKLIDETLAKFDRLDFLVNNAGASTANNTLASPNLMKAFDQVYKLNVRVPIELIQLAVPHLEKTQGNVINISSTVSLIPLFVIYGSSKAALDMVTKTAALELGPKGIRVNSINPGLVKTQFGRSVVGDKFTQEAADQMFAAWGKAALMGRIGQPEDIANLASFIASDDARNITGSIYVNDSGSVVYPQSVKLPKN